jgi:hypothetical protein
MSRILLTLAQCCNLNKYFLHIIISSRLLIVTNNYYLIRRTLRITEVCCSILLHCVDLTSWFRRVCETSLNFTFDLHFTIKNTTCLGLICHHQVYKYLLLKAALLLFHLTASDCLYVGIMLSRRSSVFGCVAVPVFFELLCGCLERCRRNGGTLLGGRASRLFVTNRQILSFL